MFDQEKKDFAINKHLTLKLEEGKTKICVDDEEFLICKAVILNIPKSEVLKVESMDDIFEISEIMEDEEEFNKYDITPLTEFWVHCSNLQVWAENNYNADLLQVNLAFPLLKRLSEIGDKTAKRIFKEEIARRYAHGTYDTKSYLEFEEFLDYLTMEEMIVGGLGYEESSLLLDIIEFMKHRGINYEIVKSFDEDKVRHRLNSSERYLTIEKGHVYVFEFDLFNESVHLFKRFSVFKGMRNLIINLGDIDEQVNFSKIKCDSIIALEFYKFSFSEFPTNIFTCFPSIEYLKIYCNFKDCIQNVDLILGLDKLKMLEYNNCFDKENLARILTILKKKKVDIINTNKNEEEKR